MRVVIDTNVLVSGLLNPHGAPGRVVDLVAEGSLTPLFDDRIVDEWRSVLRRPKLQLPRALSDGVLDLWIALGEPTTAPPIDIELRDAADLPFLEVAVAARADALVTGNLKDFRSAIGRVEVPIVGPSEFVRRWRTGLPPGSD